VDPVSRHTRLSSRVCRENATERLPDEGHVEYLIVLHVRV